MDHRRFDSLARSVATPRSRRGFLGALAALGAGLIAGQSADAQGAPRVSCGNVTCRGDACRCKPGCSCCTYANGNSRCRPSGRCAPGTESVCVEPTTTAAPDLCASTTCPVGTYCVNGECFPLTTGEPDLCAATTCPTGTYCVNGECFLLPT